ncbi:MAG: DUF192 domain-containing protein [Negativicutes bacterium]|nr:DUF192 domain-containing protein [Negativicutes bacterium]
MIIMNLTNNKILARHAWVADSFFTRLKGLLGKDRLLTGEALVIRPCNSVHTFGMRYAIDVIFADADHRVVKLVSCLGPGKMAGCLAGRYVVELPAGTLALDGTAVGHSLRIGE